MYNNAMIPANDTIRFARFVFAFHWLVYITAMVAAYAATIVPYTMWQAMLLLSINAVMVWITSREQNGWQIEDAAWHGFCVAWQDAVVTTFVLLWAYFGFEFLTQSPWWFAGLAAAGLPRGLFEYFRR